LAWLELDSQEGKDYWEAMELCGKYAEANHELIHESVIGALGCGVLGFVENHHNFAWKEMYDGEELIVHRKGAGRVMSRAAAFRTLKHADMKKILKEQGISLIGGTLDESPEVYKDINKVIDGQRDLVDVLAKFEPKLVRMAAEGNQWSNKKKKKKPENKGDEDVCM